MQFFTRLISVCVLGMLFLPALAIAAPQHQHGEAEETVKAPTIFLDKNPRKVKYQLKRLDNARLLMVERSDDDQKYLLVHEEIIRRDGMAKNDRDNALRAIATINGTDPVKELLALIPTLDETDREEGGVARQLAGLLLSQSTDLLKSHTADLSVATRSGHLSLQLAGFSGLLSSGESKLAFELTQGNPEAKSALLDSIPLLANQKARNSLHSEVLQSLDETSPVEVRRSALNALGSINADPALNFKSVGPLVSNLDLRRAAVLVLLKVPRKFRDPSTASQLAKFLVGHAEATSPADRTSNEFVQAMQLADQVLGLVDKVTSDEYRRRLGEVTVRVVLIHTVDEEMKYDIPWFAVQAGRDVQVLLKNEDLMAHNLVITKPDALEEVALLAAAEGPKVGSSGKQYVPISDKILFATEMVQAEKQVRLTFTAPTEPGEYPYVCTFPGHWMRMYGVMVVVDDLAEFQRNPIEPKDPVGSNRPIVQAWTVDDLEGKLADGLRGRTEKIGRKIFNEATCALCHKIQGEGKAVGPELTDVWARWNGDSVGVLREVLDPSHKIEPKYIMRKIITIDGEVVSGIVLAEDKDSISILPNPESTDPTVVLQDDIEDMVKSSVSIMPKGLMDRFTEDEIFELMAFLKSVSPPSQR
ncbi:MAG: putative heme-binding domain-containing protein [Mariniblastus sp.]|jgi:putative heme-binding domain-containing protein